MSASDRLLRQAEQHLNAGRHREAHAALMSVLQTDAGNAGALHLMGVVFFETGALPQAAELFQEAARIEPGSTEHLMRLAATLIGMNQTAAARQVADRALALDPRDALTLDTLGVTYTRTGDYDKAVPLFEQATALDPRRTAFLYNLGYGKQYIGDFQGAEEAYRRLLAVDPNFDKAYLALVEMTKQTPEANFIAPLKRLFAAAREPEQILAIGHALAKTYEDLGEPEAALDWLEEAKAPRRRARPHSVARDRELFAAAADTYRGPEDDTGGFASDEPIFVVGLPRTGTTLVDRILSSHPQVVSAGELQNFPVLVKQMTATPGQTLIDPDTLRAARRIDLFRLGADYVKSTRPLTGATARFVDKLPFNLLYAGLIRRALPEARIVCLRRDPMDSVLSNYRQMFAWDSPFHDYAYDLEDAARYYVGFDRLVAHWRRTMPADRFMEVSYDALVADQEAQTRRLIAFCGLDWDDRCLAFHENTAGVSTASATQVRQPLYKSSVGRWRRYGPRMEAPAAILREAGLLGEG